MKNKILKTTPEERAKKTYLQRHALTLLFFWVIFTICMVGCQKETEQKAKDKQATDTQSAYGIKKDSDKLQVGFVTVGALSDWGWNYQHNQGRLGLEAMMRDKVNTVIAENIPENADAERVMSRMCSAGAALVVSTSYGYADFCEKVAKNNPKVYFLQAQAPVKAPNNATFNGAIWEASYVAGVVAAMTADGTNYGFVGAHPIPPINWTVNAFLLGAQSINPDITVDIVYTNSWSNPAAETGAVKSLAAKKVKVVYALVDSTLAAVQAAERENIYSISHHADLSQFAPKNYITGAIWKWSPLYVNVCENIIKGNWQLGSISGGFDKGYVGLAPFGQKVNEKARIKARETIQAIIDGKISIFIGPIYDTNGSLRVKDGEILDVPSIVSMDWLVKGVKSTIKK